MSANHRISPQEFLGVISMRLAHRLANYISAAAGNVAIHDSPRANDAQRAAALDGIRESIRRSGELLDRFNELARSLKPQEERATFGEVLRSIRTWVSRHPDWHLEIGTQCSTLEQFAIAGPSKWLEFALDAIAQNAPSLIVTIDRPSLPERPRQFAGRSEAFATITMCGAQMVGWDDHRENLTIPTLTAAYELLQFLGSKPLSKEVSTKVFETKIVLPLIQ